ncbi:MAG: DUF2764 domain-containing protein [Planctomycetota bacterium]|nr:DUF2764 domain-containing protein [Planctomycetota bacterium]
MAAEHLTAPDFAALEEALAEAETPRHPWNRRWREVETKIRNASARQRGQRLRRDVALYLRPQEGVDLALEKAVADAWQRPTPLEREKALDRLRWERLEELAGYDIFHLTAILAYALRLRLCERWAAWDAAAGRERVQA